jgi:FkbM family methyltransferase
MSISLKRFGDLLYFLSDRIDRGTIRKKRVKRQILERDDRWTTCRVGEFTWRLDLTQSLDNQIFNGTFEPHTTEWIYRIVKPGMIVADVGANIGYYTIQLSKIVGTNGQVYAFEPFKAFRERLVDHLHWNHCRNVVLSELGLSDKVVTNLPIYFAGNKSGTATLVPLDDASFSEAGTAHLVTFDNYVDEISLEALDFVKVDIDGYEFRYISGALKSLARFRPIVLMEFSHLHLLLEGSGVEELALELKKLGYVLYSERTGKPYASRVNFLVDTMNCAYSSNVICVPEESNKDFLL